MSSSASASASASSPTGTSTGTPSPYDILKLANDTGYKERRTEVSSTLFFEEVSPSHGMPPVLINIYYTTRSIMTYMNHPSAGSNEMWRSNAYNDLDQLRTFFENPRRHSGKGYRRKEHAARGCSQCGMFKTRNEFSKNQWVKAGPDSNRCKDCVQQGLRDRNGPNVNATANANANVQQHMQEIIIKVGAINLGGMSLLDSTSMGTSGGISASNSASASNSHSNSHSAISFSSGDFEQDSEFPSLTGDLLKAHDQTQTQGGKNNNNRPHQKLERRQFNCPECPKHGRGKHTFFKKVPKFKPIVKCPQCKKVTRGRCTRLYPIPKSSEKGYGLFKCRACDGKWGSSRAVANIGQQCFNCLEKGKTDRFVKPFRLEMVKNKPRSRNKGGILGGGPGKMRRAPNQAPLGEDEEAHVEYTPDDRRRNDHGGNDALLGEGRRYEARGDHSQSSDSSDYDSSSVASSDVDSYADSNATPLKKVGIPSGFVHKCEGCASGICRSRYLPKSLQHDHSDGNTVSTSASVVTNSSIDKADFLDRDEDFDGFDLDAENEDWSLVSGGTN